MFKNINVSITNLLKELSLPTIKKKKYLEISVYYTSITYINVLYNLLIYIDFKKRKLLRTAD